MADFTINLSKELGRATLVSTNEETARWMERNNIGSRPDKMTSRCVAYIQQEEVEDLRVKLSEEGYSVEVKET